MFLPLHTKIVPLHVMNLFLNIKILPINIVISPFQCINKGAMMFLYIKICLFKKNAWSASRSDISM